MTWTDPKTWTAAELLRAVDLNTYLRDNLAFLYDPPTVTVRLTATQDVASGSDHTVQWSEAAWDTTVDGMWDVGTPGSLVIRRAGVYLVVAGHLWAGTSGDNSKRSLKIVKNGGVADSDELGGDDRLSTSSPQGQVSVITSLAENDYLEVVARQLSGSTLALQPLRTRCTVTWLRPNPAV